MMYPEAGSGMSDTICGDSFVEGGRDGNKVLSATIYFIFYFLLFV